MQQLTAQDQYSRKSGRIPGVTVAYCMPSCSVLSRQPRRGQSQVLAKISSDLCYIGPRAWKHGMANIVDHYTGFTR